MFRLACFDDTDQEEEGGLYRYLSSAISCTITGCLDEYIGDSARYQAFYDTCFGDGFFSGFSKYVKPKRPCRDPHEADKQAGFEFTLSKMKRMREKMLDQGEFHTFDVFEERILYLMCGVKSAMSRTAEGRKMRAMLKERIDAAKGVLMEKYGQPAYKANDYSRKMYLASAMLLKDSEDDNIIFWDDDHLFFWRDGFIKGIQYLKGFAGQSAGYGYRYTCDIFADIGVRPPLLLLGTEEANRIVNEVSQERYMEHVDGLLGRIMDEKPADGESLKSEDDYDGLPFS